MPLVDYVIGIPALAFIAYMMTPVATDVLMSIRVRAVQRQRQLVEEELAHDEAIVKAQKRRLEINDDLANAMVLSENKQAQLLELRTRLMQRQIEATEALPRLQSNK